MSVKKGKETLRWIAQGAVRVRGKLIMLLLAQVLLNITGVSMALLMREMIDNAVVGNQQAFWGYVTLMAGTVAFQIFIRAFVRYWEEAARSDAENYFKGRLFHTLLTRDYAAVTAVHSGEWMNLLTSDTVVVADGLALILPQAVGMLVHIAGALALILMLAPSFAYALIPSGFLLFALTYIFRKALKKLHAAIQESDGRLRVFLSERLENLLIVRTFGKEEQTANEAEAKMAEHKQARMRRNHFHNLCNIGFSGMMQGAFILAAVYCGYGILMGRMTYGTLTAIMLLVGQVQSPLANITGYLPKYYAMLASAERLMAAERFAIEDTDDSLKLSEDAQYYQTRFMGMALRNAAFTYLPPVRDENTPSRPVVLQDINFEFRKGEFIAITGRSGSGKSTLLKLLLCLYPLDSGDRLLLETGDVEKPLTSAYRGLFAYVPQGNQLLYGSLREIVAFSDPNKMADEASLWRALRIACAEDFVRELKEGLDTRLGEHGAGLSEGQMQRIAIARAICSEHPILVLDESTSGLDEDTERQLLSQLRTMTDQTVLIVTHRSAVMDICDRRIILTGKKIITKENGAIEYNGLHD